MNTHNKAPSSTDELLELIREPDSGSQPGPKKKRTHPVQQEKINSPSVRKVIFPAKTSFSLVRRGFQPQAVAIGVACCIEGLNLIRVDRSYNPPRIADFEHILFPEGIDADAPGFAAFLKQNMTSFCGKVRHPEVWAVLPEGKVEISHIRIPKLPRAKRNAAILWKVRREKDFDENTQVMDCGIVGEAVEDGVVQTLAYVAIAERKEVNSLRTLFNDIGYPLTGATVPSLATQNLFATHYLDNGDSVCGSIFIGREWSRIDIYQNGKLALIRNVKSGVESMANALESSYNQTRPQSEIRMAELSPDGSGAVDQPASNARMDAARAWEVLFAKLLGTPLSPGPGAELSEDEVLTRITPAMDRFMRQIERTFDHFRARAGGEPVARIYLNGHLCLSHKLHGRISELTNIPCTLLDPFSSPIMADQSFLPQDKERQGLTKAAALALSSKTHSANMLVPFLRREAQAVRGGQTQILVACTLLVALVLAGIGIWQRQDIVDLRTQLAAINTQVQKHGSMITSRDIYGECKAEVDFAKELKKTGQVYQGLAVLGEISRLTPDDIRLISLELMPRDELPGRPKIPQAASVKNKPLRYTLVMEGFVQGDVRTLEATLSSYLLKLELSPLFAMPKVPRSITEAMGEEKENKVLSFTLNIDILNDGEATS